ncbi:MAG: hypothetical protein NTW44_03530 [Nitrospirae bacterium]|nr:hypothetical protein [Nitrospirota bacterium]
MGSNLSKERQLASAGGEEELKPLVYHKSSEVIAILINNKNFTKDLKELYAAPDVPSSTKPYIYRELLERKEG